ncbi:MAG: pinensin family lanthipeptide [Cyclobacteriaceae bacterium]
MKQKLNLNDLEVKSFVTKEESMENMLKGGTYTGGVSVPQHECTIGVDHCPTVYDRECID